MSTVRARNNNKKDERFRKWKSRERERERECSSTWNRKLWALLRYFVYISLLDVMRFANYCAKQFAFNLLVNVIWCAIARSRRRSEKKRAKARKSKRRMCRFDFSDRLILSFLLHFSRRAEVAPSSLALAHFQDTFQRPRTFFSAFCCCCCCLHRSVQYSRKRTPQRLS